MFKWLSKLFKTTETKSSVVDGPLIINHNRINNFIDHIKYEYELLEYRNTFDKKGFVLIVLAPINIVHYLNENEWIASVVNVGKTLLICDINGVTQDRPYLALTDLSYIKDRNSDRLCNYLIYFEYDLKHRYGISSNNWAL